MKLWDPITLLRTLIQPQAAAAVPARRWFQARTREPELMGDVLRLGGILTAQAHEADEFGLPGPAPIDPYRLAYQAGRRDMALQLTALMGLSIHELNSLMEANDASQTHR